MAACTRKYSPPATPPMRASSSAPPAGACMTLQQPSQPHFSSIPTWHLEHRHLHLSVSEPGSPPASPPRRALASELKKAFPSLVFCLFFSAPKTCIGRRSPLRCTTRCRSTFPRFPSSDHRLRLRGPRSRSSSAMAGIPTSSSRAATWAMPLAHTASS